MSENRGLTMREILFRGKWKNSGEWVYGNLFNPDKADTPTQICIGTYIEKTCYEIDPETVGEFTGVTDKNDRKIFEGDIVKRGDRIWIIEYDVKCAQFVMKTFTERGVFFIRSFDLIPSEWCEVIGNKFDNPELMKGGNNNG